MRNAECGMRNRLLAVVRASSCSETYRLEFPHSHSLQSRRDRSCFVCFVCFVVFFLGLTQLILRWTNKAEPRNTRNTRNKKTRMLPISADLASLVL